MRNPHLCFCLIISFILVQSKKKDVLPLNSMCVCCRGSWADEAREDSPEDGRAAARVGLSFLISILRYWHCPRCHNAWGHSGLLEMKWSPSRQYCCQSALTWAGPFISHIVFASHHSLHKCKWAHWCFDLNQNVQRECSADQSSHQAPDVLRPGGLLHLFFFFLNVCVCVSVRAAHHSCCWIYIYLR